MSLRSVVRIILLLFVAGSLSFLIAKEYGFDESQGDKTPSPASAAVATASSPQPEEVASGGIVLYYFHGYRRCFTCRTIEQYMAEAIETFFPTEIATGAIAWRPVNVEEPQNRHFTGDFGLVSSGAVVAEMEEGRIKRSKNLDLVWKLVRDKPAFMEYVRNEILNFMVDGGGQ